MYIIIIIIISISFQASTIIIFRSTKRIATVIHALVLINDFSIKNTQYIEYWTYSSCSMKMKGAHTYVKYCDKAITCGITTLNAFMIAKQ